MTLYPNRNKPIGAARIVRRERFAWPGGYPLALLMSDGELLCPQCVAQEFGQISYSARHKLCDGWRPEGMVILEDSRPEQPEVCVHCGTDFHKED